MPVFEYNLTILLANDTMVSYQDTFFADSRKDCKREILWDYRRRTKIKDVLYFKLKRIED